MEKNINFQNVDFFLTRFFENPNKWHTNFHIDDIYIAKNFISNYDQLKKIRNKPDKQVSMSRAIFYYIMIDVYINFTKFPSSFSWASYMFIYDDIFHYIKSIKSISYNKILRIKKEIRSFCENNGSTKYMKIIDDLNCDFKNVIKTLEDKND